MCNDEKVITQELQELQNTPFKGQILYKCSFKIGQTIDSKGKKSYWIVNKQDERVRRLNNLKQGEWLVRFFTLGF